jgi:exodeoxyribonuclease V gamma subunit
MIHVCYSHRTEELLAALAERLAAEAAAGASPFEPVTLVVPNRNIEAYVKLGLAERRGIAANLDVQLLGDLLARLAMRAVPVARVVTVAQLEGHLLALLQESADGGDRALAPVREYLRAAGTAPEAIDRRRCQLAAELARLFDEYALSRAEMLAAWAAGRAVLADHAEDPSLADMEAWQRTLWVAIFGPAGILATRSTRQGVTWLALPDLVAAAAAQGFAGLTGEAVLTRNWQSAARGEAPGRALHVFGLSYMAPGYHRMLAALGRRWQVRIYTLNPCREFWEDVETQGELRRRLKREGRQASFPGRQEARQPGLALGDDPLGLDSDAEMLALRLWGRPGRENVRLLNQLTDGDFEGHFPPAAPTTLLGRLQEDILDRTARRVPDPALRADGSLTVLRCPGLRRELEVVAAEIWRLLRADPTLRLREVAVVVPEAQRDLYLSQVGAVFGEACGLPHSVIDLPLGGGHRLGEAALMLLALPTGALGRRELLPLLTHPSVMGRFPEASAAQWLRLADELGIVHGADHQDHAGTYIERDLLNWDQGLRRLCLGAVMTGPRAGDERPVRFGDQDYLPADLPPDAQGSALDFALLARSLIADARFAAGRDGAPRLRPLPEWLELVRGMLASYLVPADDDDDALLGRCLRALEELEDVEVVGRAGTAQPVSYLVAAELARRAFAGIGGARGQYLARGVQVASFVPMRAIPFRAVFVLGLGHGLYPAGARRGQLDLRQARRAAGDVAPRERDLYLFLETLLSARDRLVLSYVARDQLTGEALPPSSVLLELREILAEGYLDPRELARVFEAPAPPLRRHDDDLRLEAAPLARREQRARALGQSLRAALPGNTTAALDLRLLDRALPPATAALLAARLGSHRPPAAASSAAPRTLVVPLGAIRQFLEDPLQGSARFRLGLRELDDPAIALEHDEEVFESDGLGRTTLLREVMLDAILGAREPPAWSAIAAAHDRLALREELAGRMPTGLFQVAERGGHEAILRGWLAALQTLAGEGFAEREVTRFGAGPAALGGTAGLLGRDDATRACEPIALSVQGPGGGGETLAVQLVGRTELLLLRPVAASASKAGAPGTGSLVLTCRRDGDPRPKDRLRAFVDHLALSAAGLSAVGHEALVAWSCGGQHRVHRACFAPLAPERARAYLAALVTDMLTGARDAGGRPTGVHDYLLPCEAVFEAAARPGRDVVEEVERLRDTYFELPARPFSSVMGPVPEAAERHQPPPPAEAARMVQARFGLYFELLAGGPP